MKRLKMLVLSLLAFALFAAPFCALAADAKAGKAPPAADTKTAYLLKKCLVSDEELGGMGDAFVFKYQEKEVRLCCKSCKKDFDKDPKKFMKKLADAEKKAAAKK